MQLNSNDMSRMLLVSLESSKISTSNKWNIFLFLFWEKTFLEKMSLWKKGNISWEKSKIYI